MRPLVRAPVPTYRCLLQRHNMAGSSGGRRPMSERESDSLQAVAPERSFGEDESSRLLDQALRQMNAVGDEGEREYANVIRQLRANPRRVVETAGRLLEQTD